MLKSFRFRKYVVAHESLDASIRAINQLISRRRKQPSISDGSENRANSSDVYGASRK
jgi:hypothetical protein